MTRTALKHICAHTLRSKAYKFQTSVSGRNFKKRKETKKALDDKQKYGGYSITVPLSALAGSPVIQFKREILRVS